MTLRILSAAEIEALSSQADFAGAGQQIITTADLKAIDSAAASACKAIAEAQGLPVFEFRGALARPAVPEDLRRFAPKERWVDSSEPMSFDVRGVEADGYRILHFAAAGQKGRSDIWGLPQGAGKLVFKRSMPIGPVSSVTSEALRAALAAQEAAEIGSSAGPGRGSEKPPRI